MTRVLMLLPESDYDPTETAVPWAALTAAGHEVVFATPKGVPAFADERLVKTGFGPFNPFLMPRKADLAHYWRMTEYGWFRQPLAYADLARESYGALVVPGGHAQGVKTLIESKEAQACVLAAFKARKPVGAICHGVLLLARSVDRQTGKSVLYGRKTTALTKPLEMSAWMMTRWWLKDYFRTYRQPVQDEVKTALAKPSDFKSGAPLALRDSPRMRSIGYTVRDRNYLSARWPGDCHRFARDFLAMLDAQSAR